MLAEISGEKTQKFRVCPSFPFLGWHFALQGRSFQAAGPARRHITHPNPRRKRT